MGPTTFKTFLNKCGGNIRRRMRGCSWLGGMDLHHVAPKAMGRGQFFPGLGHWLSLSTCICTTSFYMCNFRPRPRSQKGHRLLMSVVFFLAQKRSSDRKVDLDDRLPHFVL